MSTIFDKIVSGEFKSWIVWEDENHMAFLTPFPNTPGYTVVIPKKNVGDYVFSLPEDEFCGLLRATKKVAKMLEKAMDTGRVAMIFEGTGVAHVHAKLIPLHGELADKTGVWSDIEVYNDNYLGYLTTAEGPKMSDKQLDEIQAKIKAAA